MDLSFPMQIQIGIIGSPIRMAHVLAAKKAEDWAQERPAIHGMKHIKPLNPTVQPSNNYEHACKC